MTTRGFRWRTTALIVLTSAAMAGCGVKNLPTAPSGETPAAARQSEAAGANGGSVFGGLSGGDSRSAARTERIAGVDTNDTVSAAEVSRNPEAKRRSFFLDPLLN